jgi:cytochrome c553
MRMQREAGSLALAWSGFDRARAMVFLTAARRGLCCALLGGTAMLGLAIGMHAGAAAPDLELGRYLASECMTCHRGATATAAIPNIFGRAEQDIVRLVRAYRDKELPNAVMQNVAGRLKDDEIAALAAYLATTPKP